MLLCSKKKRLYLNKLRLYEKKNDSLIMNQIIMILMMIMVKDKNNTACGLSETVTLISCFMQAVYCHIKYMTIRSITQFACKKKEKIYDIYGNY